MADVYVNSLTTISNEPTSTDSIVCVNRNTNEGQIIDYNLLADKILSKITSKTFSGLTTTSKLLTGAINEHESDIAGLSASSTGINDLVETTIASSGTWTDLSILTLPQEIGLYFISAYVVFQPSSTSTAYYGIIGTQTSGCNVLTATTSLRTGNVERSASKEMYFVVRINSTQAQSTSTITLRAQSSIASMPVQARIGYFKFRG